MKTRLTNFVLHIDIASLALIHHPFLVPGPNNSPEPEDAAGNE